MARRGRNDGQEKLPLERQMGKALTDEEVATKSQELCGVYTAIEGIEEEIRTQTRAKKDEIKALKARAKNIRQAIVDGIEMRKQGTLRYEEAEAARKDLAKVAAAAGENSDRKPLPSEAHEFRGNGKKDECQLCGGTQADPIHGKAALVTAGMNAAAEMPEGKAKDLTESLARVVGGDRPEDVIKHVLDKRAKRTKAKGPLGRKRGREARA